MFPDVSVFRWPLQTAVFRLICALIAMPAAHATAPSSPLVIAHRGASGYLPEHTLAAKALAHGQGADYLEQDLVLSRDGVPIVLHDIHLDTVTDVARRFPERKRSDGRYYVLDFTVAELKQLQVSERFNPATGRAVFPRRFPLARASFQLSTLEEELQLIQGLNQSTGRIAGIYPELKQPSWHRAQGVDLTREVLPILERYGYARREAPCFVQCFELTEIRRLRGELGWVGRLVMLIEASPTGDDGTDYEALCRPPGLRTLASLVDGIGPPVSRIITWSAGGSTSLTSLVADAHQAGLLVHPYTLRLDQLPDGCASADDLHHALFHDAGVDGAFTDFPDMTAAWLKRAR